MPCHAMPCSLLPRPPPISGNTQRTFLFFFPAHFALNSNGSCGLMKSIMLQPSFQLFGVPTRLAWMALDGLYSSTLSWRPFMATLALAFSANDILFVPCQPAGLCVIHSGCAAFSFVRLFFLKKKLALKITVFDLRALSSS